MSEQKHFKMSGPISGVLGAFGGTSKLNDMEANVGSLSGQLILSPSELADRMEELPAECGGSEFVAALRGMDPNTRLLVNSDGPITFDSSPAPMSEATKAMKTVADLIAELRQLPPEYEVQVYGQGGMEGCPCVPELEVETPAKAGFDTAAVEADWSLSMERKPRRDAAQPHRSQAAPHRRSGHA